MADRARAAEIRRRERITRLIRWGWPLAEAEALAARIAARDALDTRRTCTECASFNAGRCSNHAAAGLFGSEIGRDLAGTAQRCPGHSDER